MVVDVLSPLPFLKAACEDNNMAIGLKSLQCAVVIYATLLVTKATFANKMAWRSIANIASINYCLKPTPPPRFLFKTDKYF
jgi:hypothetical protein